MTKRWMAALLLAGLCLPKALAAQAAELPDRPVRIVVPFAPGGSADIAVRILADGAAAYLPRGTVIDNRSGGNGLIGMGEVARSTPDGTTLVQCTIGICGINASLYPNLPYNLANDFAPVILSGAVGNVMTVRRDLPARTVAEVVALAKSEPQGLTYGSSAVGASNHLAPELLRVLTGAQMTHVPYRGSAPAVTDLVAGRIDVFFDNIPSVIQQIRAGNARPLAVAAEARDPRLPDVPTFDEQGQPGMVILSWFGFLAPARTPPAVIGQLNAAFNRALQDPAVRARLEEVGVAPLGGTPEHFGEHIRAEVERWGKVVRANNLKPE